MSDWRKKSGLHGQGLSRRAIGIIIILIIIIIIIISLSCSKRKGKHQYITIPCV